jgi:chemotaxis signal transduction protein
MSKMKLNFFLHTTFLLKIEDGKQRIQIRCLGCREILKPASNVPKHILGTVEFGTAYIPVVDLGAAFGIEPLMIDNTKCILIVEHKYESFKLHTGIIIQNFEEIMKLAAGIFELGAGLGASPNMHFVLEMQNNCNDGHEVLIESHKILSLLEESNTKISGAYSSRQLSGSQNFMNELETMDFLQRQVVLEELANKSELWDKESNVMCL